MTLALLADGHVLVEDVPGTGKTLLARAVARALDLRTARIQGTPDLLPTDVTGSSIFEGGGAPLRRRPRLHEHPPRRRDQPGDAADAVGAPRGDAGAAGLDRGDDASPPRTVRRPRHPEPDRVRGDVRAAPGPARPISSSGSGSATRTRPASGGSPAATRSDAEPLERITPIVDTGRLLALRDAVRRVHVGRRGRGIRRRARPGDAGARGHPARREPAGDGRALPRCPGGGRPRGSRVRPAG